MSCKTSRNIVRAIVALPNDFENKRLLVAFAMQLRATKKLFLGCRNRNKCKADHLDAKLEYYWNTYGPKEMNHGIK